MNTYLVYARIGRATEYLLYCFFEAPEKMKAKKEKIEDFVNFLREQGGSSFMYVLGGRVKNISQGKKRDSAVVAYVSGILKHIIERKEDKDRVRFAGKGREF